MDADGEVGTARTARPARPRTGHRTASAPPDRRRPRGSARRRGGPVRGRPHSRSLRPRRGGAGPRRRRRRAGPASADCGLIPATEKVGQRCGACPWRGIRTTGPGWPFRGRATRWAPRPPSGRRVTQPGRRSPTRSPPSSPSRWSSTRASAIGRDACSAPTIEIVEAPLDEFWMRDIGPTFVVDDERPGVLGAVDWVFNGWGAPDWAEWEHVGGDRPRGRGARRRRAASARASSTRAAASTSTARAPCCSPRPCSSTRAATRYADQRAGGGGDDPHARRHGTPSGCPGASPATTTSSAPERPRRHRGDHPLARPACCCTRSPTRRTPTTRWCRELRASRWPATTDAAGRPFEIIDLPAPATLTRRRRASSTGATSTTSSSTAASSPAASARPRRTRAARAILAEAYPGRTVVTVDARDDLRPRRRHPLHHPAAAAGSSA